MFQAKSTILQSGLVLDEFEKTSVNMSTYLVAFVVANFTPMSKNVSDTLVGQIQRLLSAFFLGLLFFFSEALLLLIQCIDVCVYTVYCKLVSVCFRCPSTLCQKRRSTLCMLWRQCPSCWSFTISSLKLNTPLKS